MPASAGETILLVEDNPDVRVVTASRLVELGYHVVDVESGPEAIKALQLGETIDLVFSDIVMAGGMSGFDVASGCAPTGRRSSCCWRPAIADEALRGDERGLGDLKILRKPYSRGELARTLRQLLDA